MKAMILAAGEGRRMRPLTDATPKPLLMAGGLSLLEHHIINLRDAGFTDLVVNAAYLGSAIRDFCGDGSRWNVSLTLSWESEPLETAGAVVHALPLLGDEPFLVINGDIFCPYPFSTFPTRPIERGTAHLILVPNPPHNDGGDFSLLENQVTQPSGETWTFSGIGLYHPRFFADIPSGKRALKPLFDAAISRGRLSGQLWHGRWTDVGTPERLRLLNDALAREFS